MRVDLERRCREQRHDEVRQNLRVAEKDGHPGAEVGLEAEREPVVGRRDGDAGPRPPNTLCMFHGTDREDALLLGKAVGSFPF